MRAGILVLLLACAVFGQYDEEEDYDDYSKACRCPGDKRCFCVDNNLCFPNNTINFEGWDLVNPRIDSDPVEDCGDEQTCCQDTNDEPLELPTTPSPHDACGVRGGNTAPTRVLGEGTNTEFAEFPWMLAIYRQDKSDGSTEMQCGASLVASRLAITAAHCVNDYKNDPSVLSVRAGEWDLNSTTEAVPHQEQSVAAIVVHDEYFKGSLRNDIAILMLDDHYNKTSNLGLICIPSQDTNFEGRKCVATGWGRDVFGNKGKFQTVLRKVDLPIVPNAECQKRLRKTRLSRFFRLHESFICAGGERNTDTCEGDGGGPLVCEMDDGRYEQAGIVSWGIGCGEKELPGVYVGVAKFIVWMKKQFKLLGFTEE